MSVSGIGSGAAKEYSALYSNQAAASRHRAGEVKAPAKADSVVKTRQRGAGCSGLCGAGIPKRLPATAGQRNDIPHAIYYCEI
ncbi:hypothetical protein C823_004861 [Eubacterium plexicaudatum ASF492]|nr:hypothetical protein C823_004861 [Eubacterium plexicaudatum ASF492]